MRRGGLVRVRRMRSTFTATSADRSTGKRSRATGRWWGRCGYNRNGTRGGASQQTMHVCSSRCRGLVCTVHTLCLAFLASRVAASSIILSILLPPILHQSRLPFCILHSITLRSRPANSTLQHCVLRAIPALVGPPPTRDLTSFTNTDAPRALDTAYTSVSAMSRPHACNFRCMESSCTCHRAGGRSGWWADGHDEAGTSVEWGDGHRMGFTIFLHPDHGLSTLHKAFSLYLLLNSLDRAGTEHGQAG
ncbi:hypothetical protein K438DRAFT_912281 [Mycena galopus ATCC 62051]|nr:hypothetical protein K438DRAFT_912281 [Mycena galopus ATCC 62051]